MRVYVVKVILTKSVWRNALRSVTEISMYVTITML